MCPVNSMGNQLCTFILVLFVCLVTPTASTALGRNSLSRSKTNDRGRSFNQSPSSSSSSVVTVNASELIENAGEGGATSLGAGEDDEVQYPFESTNVNSSLSAKTEEQVPAIPSSLKTEVTATSIFVTWSPPKSSKIRVRGYTIGWGIGIPDVYSKMLDVRARSYHIENLQPGSEYVISLRAYNSAGDGQPAYDNVRTLQIDAIESPSLQLFPPVGLKSQVLSSSSITLQWSDKSNRPVNDVRLYIIRYASLQRAPLNKYKYANTSKTSITIEDLKASTQYEFTVKLVRGRLESMWSMSVVNRTLDTVPSNSPRNLTVRSFATGNGSSVYLHWQPLRQSSLNSPVNGYTVVYWREEDTSSKDKWLSHTVTGVESSDTVINNLSAGSTYVFQMHAYNEAGTGPSSASVTFQTDSSRKLSISRGRELSTVTVFTIAVSIAGMIIILFLVISLIFCRSKRPAVDRKNRKGVTKTSHVSYSPAASSPKDECENTQLHPPDLWIHHHEQLEMKSSDKSNVQEEVEGMTAAASASVTAGPILRTFRENETESLERASSRYLHTSSSLYDMTRNLPFDGTVGSCYPSTAAITTIRRAPRCQAALLINATTGMTSDSGHLYNVSTSNSTTIGGVTGVPSISRCLCPGNHGASVSCKPQCTLEMTDHLKVPRYNAISYNSSDIVPFPTTAANWFNNNIAPSYSSSGNTSSCALSPTDVSSTHTASTASLNNLTVRPLPGLQSITGYTVTTSVTTDPPHSTAASCNVSKHIAVKPQVIPPPPPLPPPSLSTGTLQVNENSDAAQLKKHCHGQSNSTLQSII